MVELKYRVENAAVAPKQREIEVDGQPGTFTVNRLSVELVSVDHSGGTIALDLEPDTEGFGEGTEVTVTFGKGEAE